MNSQPNQPASTATEVSTANASPLHARPVGPKTIVYACSGCSDAGELADRIARRLAQEGVAEMSCLAGIGGRVKSLMAKGQKADRIVAIDGCPLTCARHTLELAGFETFEHLGLHEVGLRKGQCPVTEANIAAGVEAAKALLAKNQQANLPRDTLGPPEARLASVLAGSQRE